MASAPDTGERLGSVASPERESQPVLVEAGTRFVGLVGCRAGARIEGELKGDITAQGRIELGEFSRVTGIVEADEIVVAGRFEGSLVAKQKIELLSTARVEGDLETRELIAEDGCAVRGSCSTGRSTAQRHQPRPPS